MNMNDDETARRQAAREVRAILALNGYDPELAEKDLEPYLSGWLTPDEMIVQLSDVYQRQDEEIRSDEDVEA